MRPRDRELAAKLETSLISFHDHKIALPGIIDPVARQTFIEQLIESIRRVNYVTVISQRDICIQSTDPNDNLFDPLKASILFRRQGKLDEAFWMVFMFVHFGKHARAGWRYIREIYGRLGDSNRWDWINTSADLVGFRKWLDDHQTELKRAGTNHGFGNHRKYESLNAYSANGTGAVVESYINWVGSSKSHKDRFDAECSQTGGNPHESFDRLFHSMNAITRFGRTARFDYLAMIGKLGLADIEPGSAYLKSSTGPIKGARLLFLDQPSPASHLVLDCWLIELNKELNVGMQALEDALCNWQKSPRQLKKFRG